MKFTTKQYYTKYSELISQFFISSNIETSRVTIKQCYKIILFQRFLSIEADIFRELLQNTTDFFQGNCTRQYFFLFQMWTYSKSLLTGISASITFRTVYDKKNKKLKKFKKWYTVEIFIIFCYNYRHLFSQVGFTIQKWILLKTNTCQTFYCHAQYCCVLQYNII